MRWPVAAAIILALLAGPVLSQTVKIRSGNHPDFARLVLPFAAPSKWRLGRDGKDYVLVISGDGIELDASEVYRLIPQDRVAAVQVSEAGKALRITPGCDCHVNAFSTPSGVLVIDFAEGAPDPGSPFEKPVSASKPAARPAGEPPVALPALWQRGGGPMAAGIGAGWLDRAAPAGVTGPGDPAQPRAGRMGDMARLLEWQISRAMSQGLVEPGRNWADERGDDARRARPAEAGSGHPAAPPMPGTAPQPGGPLPVTAETAMDALAGAEPAAHAPECPDPSLLSFGDGPADSPAAGQLSDARAALVGEFDRPDPARVTALAHVYLGLGFGAEAALVLRAFGPETATSAVLAEIARIVDAPAPDPASPAASWADCGDDGALWAMLGAEGSTPDRDAVLRAFARLPPSLRGQLAAPLASAFRAQGDSAAAAVVQDAVLRAPGESDPATRLLQAENALAFGHPREALALAEPLLHGQGIELAGAALLVQRAHADLGQTVPPAVTELLGTLAFELRQGPLGPDMAVAHALALASAAEFDAAFAALGNLPAGGRAGQVQEAAERLFDTLAERAEDDRFITVYFAQRKSFDPGTGQDEVRLALARRLARLGFRQEALAELGTTPPGTAGRLLSLWLRAEDGDPAARADLDARRHTVVRPAAPVAADDVAAPHGPGSAHPGAQSGPSQPPAGPATGPIAAGRALLERSQAAQSALDLLLGASEPDVGSR